MKKILSTALVLLLVLSLFSGCGNTAKREDVLKVYNWEDYIDEEVIEDFTAYYNEKYNTELTVVYDTFDTNETMYTKIANGEEDYDLACPSEYTIERMVKNGLVKKMDEKIVGEAYNASVPEMIRLQLASVTGNTERDIYSVGYMWGTLGIMYNKNDVTMEELESQGWEILWNEKYSGKIFMKDSIRDSYAVANIYVYKDEYLKLQEDFKSGKLSQEEYTAKVGEIFNRTDATTIELIEKALKEQKEKVDAMYDVDNDKNSMVNGTAYLDVAWSGDAQWAIVEAEEAGKGVELGYYVPKEGTNIWFDGWVIPKYAVNERAANEFVAYLLRSEIVTRIMDATGYSSVATDVSGAEERYILDYAKEMATEEDVPSDVSYFFEGATNETVNAVMYPSLDIVSSSAVMQDFGDANDAISQMWSRVKGNDLSPVTIIVLVVVAAGAIAIVAVLGLKKKNQAKRRGQRKTARKQ